MHITQLKNLSESCSEWSLFLTFLLGVRKHQFSLCTSCLHDPGVAAVLNSSLCMLCPGIMVKDTTKKAAQVYIPQALQPVLGQGLIRP